MYSKSVVAEETGLARIARKGALHLLQLLDTNTALAKLPLIRSEKAL